LTEEGKLLPAGSLKRIHVNKQVIASNRLHGTNDPVFTTKWKGRTYRAQKVIVHGPSQMINPEKPLSCGARAWVETHSAVSLIPGSGNLRTTDDV